MLSASFCSTAGLKEQMQIVNKHHSYGSFYGTGSSSYLRLPWMWYSTSCKLFIYPEIPRIQQYFRHNREQLYCIHRFRIHSTMLKRSKNSWNPRYSWRKASTLLSSGMSPHAPWWSLLYHICRKHVSPKCSFFFWTTGNGVTSHNTAALKDKTIYSAFSTENAVKPLFLKFPNLLPTKFYKHAVRSWPSSHKKNIQFYQILHFLNLLLPPELTLNLRSSNYGSLLDFMFTLTSGINGGSCIPASSLFQLRHLKNSWCFTSRAPVLPQWHPSLWFGDFFRSCQYINCM